MPHQDWRESLDDRSPRSGSFGDRSMSFLRRIFGDGENPLRWGIPLYRAFGIRVRLHVFFALWLIFQLIGSLPKDNFGFLYTAPILVALFVLVLLHEYGHCFACRAVGGEADEIMLWPLGGLAYCLPPRHWRAELATVLGGPGVNAVLFPFLFGAVWLATGSSGAVLFNPFAPGAAIPHLAAPPLPLWFTYALWCFYYTNFVLLAFNALVPMFPLDGGRILHCILWARLDDERRALLISTMVGLVAAGTLGVLALVTEELILLVIALFGGVTCYMERRSLRFAEYGGVPGAGDLFAPSRGDTYDPRPEPEPDPRPSRRELRREEREREEQEEVDRILAKISAQGMAALTPREKRVLRRATERSRSG